MARIAVIGAVIGSLAATPIHARHAEGSGCPSYVVEWFDSNAHAACSISFCESRWNEFAINFSSGTRGLFQFLRSTFLRTQIGRELGWDAAFDGPTNAWAAYEVSGGGRNWSEWQCRS